MKIRFKHRLIQRTPTNSISGKKYYAPFCNPQFLLIENQIKRTKESNKKQCIKCEVCYHATKQ